MPGFYHQSVLPEETIEYLAVKPDGIYVDATIGGAGHAGRIAAQLDERGVLIGIDQDPAAIHAATERLQGVKARIELVKRNFVDLQVILRELGIVSVDGIIFDLGVSSPQFDEGERGFSFHQNAPLDMRMDQMNPFSAAHLINSAPVADLSRILWEYGEERWAKRIALFIEKRRRESPIQTTDELVAVIKDAIPAAARRSGPHPARRTFQALRIAVNHELEYLAATLEQAVTVLKTGGRVVVISFHSLEDRIVKNTFAAWSAGCECPKNIPVCCCGKLPKVRILTKKPVVPRDEEVADNPRARSAKLRAVAKI